jgi:hypothetical protein
MNDKIDQLALQATDSKGGLDRHKFAELIVRQCGYYADVFESLGCPVDMDPTDTKPSDYIKKHFGVEE